MAGNRDALRNRFAPKPLLGIASVMLLFSFFWKSGCLQENGFPHKSVKQAKNQLFFIFNTFKKFSIFALSAGSCCTAGSAFICQFINVQFFLNAFIFCRFQKVKLIHTFRFFGLLRRFSVLFFIFFYFLSATQKVTT